MLSNRSRYSFIVYVPIEQEFAVRKYVQDCKLTNRTASARVLQFILEDLARVNEELEGLTVICELCNREVTTGAKAQFSSGAIMTVCEPCLKAKSDKGLLRRILREYH